MFFAEVIIFVLAAFSHLFLERPVQVFEVNSKQDATSTEGVGYSDLLEVVDTDEVGNGRFHSLSESLGHLLHLVLVTEGDCLEDDFQCSRIFVLEEADGSKHVVAFILGKLEVSMEHFLEFESFELHRSVCSVSHSIMIMSR